MPLIAPSTNVCHCVTVSYDDATALASRDVRRVWQVSHPVKGYIEIVGIIEVKLNISGAGGDGGGELGVTGFLDGDSARAGDS